jgi:hypothetical protein
MECGTLCRFGLSFHAKKCALRPGFRPVKRLAPFSHCNLFWSDPEGFEGGAAELFLRQAVRLNAGRGRG